jgi:hypothetical protein
MTKQWFDVDRVGLGKQAEEHGKGRLIGELVQNALDEAGITKIDIRLELVPGRPLADLTVEDDSPEGFREQLLQMGVRAEQQALAKWGLNYVIEEYLPRKLKNREKFLP